MVWVKWLGLALGLLVLALVVALVGLNALGRWHWAGKTRALLAQMEAAREPAAPARYKASELPGLPAPVQRYFRAALQDGTPIVGAADVEHVGTFNLGERADNWKPFSSHQRVVTQGPGFVWDGRIDVLPAFSVRVHDAYVAGEGILHPAVLGLFSLMDLRGTQAIAEGELMRYLAEAAWYPTALLPSQGVRWTAVDDSSAKATLKNGPLTVSLTFTFDTADGLIEAVHAEARGRTEGGQVVMRPWEGRWSDYQWHDGMRVPMSGEVAWLLPAEEGGRKPYWRGSITALRYEPSR